jgi:choline dehydrogenase
MSPCVWEANEPITGRNNLAEATAVWKSSSALDTPDLQTIMVERLYASPQVLKSTPPPHLFWALSTAVVRTMSRGRLHLTGAGVHDPIEIEAAALDDPDDVTALKNCLEFCRAIGNSSALHPFAKREFLPGPLRGAELDNFIRSATVSHSHQTCTAKMGNDPLSVVDNRLRVYGVEGLRVADGSILPRVTTGNTMAPCVVVGERAAELLQEDHQL